MQSWLITDLQYPAQKANRHLHLTPQSVQFISTRDPFVSFNPFYPVIPIPLLPTPYLTRPFS